jgi:hypothetical protein
MWLIFTYGQSATLSLLHVSISLPLHGYRGEYIEKNVPFVNLIPHILPETLKTPPPSASASGERNFKFERVIRYIEFGLVLGLTNTPAPSRGKVDKSLGREVALIDTDIVVVR